MRLRFCLVARNPLRRSCVSRARNAGKIAFWPGPAQPSAEIARVEGAKMQARLRAALLEEVSYETLVLETWHFTKRWFWRLGASLLEEVSCETLVLETWRSRTRRSFWRLGASPLRTFGGSLETLLLETWALHVWSWTRTWPVCSANLRERVFRSWTQKWPVKCSPRSVCFYRVT